jgi:hypothetical protein
MKKYTYEITVEAEHEHEADTKIRGLALLTGGVVLPNHHKGVLPLSEEEQKLIQFFRKGEKLAAIFQHLLNAPSEIDFYAFLTELK